MLSSSFQIKSYDIAIITCGKEYCTQLQYLSLTWAYSLKYCSSSHPTHIYIAYRIGKITISFEITIWTCIQEQIVNFNRWDTVTQQYDLLIGGGGQRERGICVQYVWKIFHGDHTHYHFAIIHD